MKKKSPKKNRKAILWAGFVLLLTVIAGAIAIRKTLLQPFSLKETVYIRIDKETNYENVVEQLKQANLPSEKIFRFLSKRMNYSDAVKSGRYAVKNGMNMLDVIRMLRSGKQAPINLTFNNLRTKENLAGRISQQLMMDSIELLNALNDETRIKKLGFDSSNVVAVFIPNTYEVYWDISVNAFLERMKKEYDRFWNPDRKRKADRLGLSPAQVSTLASIVEEEASYADEYPTVAGLYLNRLRKGMKLQADPTVKFAVGDFGLRRILFHHLYTDSPYNTYKYTGLPPGPIRVPSISAIDATLSPETHNYLFMCAKDNLSGRHNFAATHAEHVRNAAAYQRILNNRRIY